MCICILESLYTYMWASQVVPVVKNPPANAGRHKGNGFDPWVGKIPTICSDFGAPENQVCHCFMYLVTY